MDAIGYIVFYRAKEGDSKKGFWGRFSFYDTTMGWLQAIFVVSLASFDRTRIYPAFSSPSNLLFDPMSCRYTPF
jgi:hypothetical protein